MYLGRGITKIVSGSKELFKRANIHMTPKEITDKYIDISNNRQSVFLGYEIVFTLEYTFTKDENDSQTALRELINLRDVTLYPRIDQMQFAYACELALQEDNQEDITDKLKVVARVKNLQNEIPYIGDTPS